MTSASAAGEEQRFDVLVLGAGPAGHKAAIQAAKAGKRVLVVDRDPAAGGECVQRGTIPSKTLRASACALADERARRDAASGASGPVRVSSLMRRLNEVRAAHERYLGQQLERNGVVRWRGRARFLSSERVEVRAPDRSVRSVRAEWIVIATGSRPRQPEHVPLDHEHVLDSDSILELIYLPESLAVLGGGIIACEFASIFAALGTRVTLIDAGARPLVYVDPEIAAHFVAGFEALGGRLLSNARLESVSWDGSAVATRLAEGELLRSEKLLCALGRVANVADLGLESAGIALSPRGHIPVDEHLRTSAAHIYAAGDVVGPPALAATAAEQGRRAARHALGLPLHSAGELVPVGIYTIPEIASVGLSEQEARAKFGSIHVGRARFDELARAQIDGQTRGLLKLIADPAGRLLGAHVVGAGATELVHVAQMALIGGLTLEAFVDHVFNFPTFAEAYRVAAIDALARGAVRQAA